MGKRSLKVNAILNVIKEAVNILFPIITFPYVSTTLGTFGYGKYTYSAYIVSYITYIAAAGILRYAVRECAVVRDNKKKVEELVNEIYTINIFTTIIAFAILAVLLIFWPKLHPLAVPILILSLMVLFATLGCDWVNSAFEDFAFIAIRHVICQTIALGLVFALVRTSDDVVGYAIASSFGVVVPNIINRIHLKKAYGITPRFSPKSAYKKHIKAIALLFASTIGTYIYINSDVTILGIFYDDDIVGIYGVSGRYYTLIKQIINAAFIVLIPRISKELAKDTHKSVEALKKILGLTIVAIVPASVGLIMIRKNLILLFQDETYARAESSILILAIAIIPALLANFYINIVMIPLKREKQVMIATLVSAGANIVLNLVFIPLFAENAAAATTLLSEFVMLGLGMYWTRDMHIKGVLKPVIASLTGGIGIAGLCFYINSVVSRPLWGVLLPVLFCGILYLAVLFVFFHKEIISLVKNKKLI